MKLPELLAPVGSLEHLKTAILSGANSIYLSGENFGARRHAENFSVPEIREAVKYAHLHNVKVYLTVNTLIKEGELEKITSYLLELYEIGVDAVLIQDIGLIKIIKENIPKLRIHASTQMNIHNIEAIKWASKQGIKRVVLPRETKLNELKEIIDYAHLLNIEIEIFAHGALCYSYSGHCLLYSLQGGRSGNRGTCAQPCRERYELNINKSKKIKPKTEGDYLLSPKDLSLYEHLDEIVNLEIDSIKIEGRMRSNDYVATVVKNYRKRLNRLRYDKRSQKINRSIKELERKSKGKKGRNSDFKKIRDKENITHLKEEQKLENLESLEEIDLVFNREFTTGHLIPKNNPMIMNRKKPGHQGLYIGKIHRYNLETEEIHILLKDNLIHIPEKGDGILIETNPNLKDNRENIRKTKKTNNEKTKTKQDKRSRRKEKRIRNEINQNNQSNDVIQRYGFDISSKPILKDSKDKHWRKREKDKDIEGKVLVIRIVRENKRIAFPLTKGSKVYLTKKNSLLKEVKDLQNKKEEHNIKKSLLELYFRIDSANYPHLKGNLKLDNGKVITLKIKGEKAWEEAIKKPISDETIKRQLLKIGDLPYYIEKITVKNNKRLFSPISEINELRRNFFNKLEEKIIESYKPKDEDLKIAEENIKNLNENLRKKIDLKSKVKSNLENIENDKNSYNLSAYINSLEILKELNKGNESIFNRIYLEIPADKDFEEISQGFINNPLENNELNISYSVNFLKEAIEISQTQDYKLIWKLPDIAHKQTKEYIIKIIGILRKMNLDIDIMTSLIGLDDALKDKFHLELYGNYPLNIYNIETVLELNNFELLSISPELYKKNIKDLMESYYKELSKNKDNKDNKDNNRDNNENNRTNNDNKLPELELLVHGNIESMITRKELISKKQLKLINKYTKKQRKENNHNKENSINQNNDYYIDSNEYYLKNRKGQYYPIKTSLNEDNLIILNSEEFCLFDEINYLKSVGISNFSIDLRWKPLEYIKEIGKVYRDIIYDKENNMEESRKTIDTYCPNLTKANFEKGLK